jgi:hypothetical protein
MTLTHEINWHGLYTVLATGTRSEIVGDKIEHDYRINYQVMKNKGTTNTNHGILLRSIGL